MKIIIDTNTANQRIDKFLVKEFFNYTRGEIIRSIKSGDILINGQLVKPSYILKEKDEILLRHPMSKSETLDVLAPNPDLKIKIIYRDKNIIVADKPAGIATHPVKSNEKNTLVNFLLAQFPEIKNINDGSAGSEFRPGIVHRLDKGTSGVMAVARNKKSFDELKKLFQNREIKKEYLAVVFGQLENKKGLIEKPIARAKNYKKQTVAGAKTRTKIRPAVTAYEVLKEYENYSLARALPKTGRTHQIRVHFSALGHPIVGDQTYGHKNTVTPSEIGRQLLHAQRLEFELFGKKYLFTAKIPADMEKFLNSLTPLQFRQN